MIEIIEYWTLLVAAIAAFIVALLKLLEAWEKLFKWLPKPLKDFLVYGLAIIIPYTAIIWWFFYLAGLSPERLSEPVFFWALVTQPTLGVSIYTYVWSRWIYPKLQHILDKSTTPQKPKNESHNTKRSSRNGGKKR